MSDQVKIICDKCGRLIEYRNELAVAGFLRKPYHIDCFSQMPLGFLFRPLARRWLAVGVLLNAGLQLYFRYQILDPLESLILAVILFAALPTAYNQKLRRYRAIDRWLALGFALLFSTVSIFLAISGRARVIPLTVLLLATAFVLCWVFIGWSSWWRYERHLS
jgi:amino acid transporter